jgi:hypothetical protein
MGEITRTNLENLHSEDRAVQNAAFFTVIEATETPVDWAYTVWDGDGTIREKALALIDTEADPKYRKKYTGVWKNA